MRDGSFQLRLDSDLIHCFHCISKNPLLIKIPLTNTDLKKKILFFLYNSILTFVWKNEKRIKIYVLTSAVEKSFSFIFVFCFFNDQSAVLWGYFQSEIYLQTPCPLQPECQRWRTHEVISSSLDLWPFNKKLFTDRYTQFLLISLAIVAKAIACLFLEQDCVEFHAKRF